MLLTWELEKMFRQIRKAQSNWTHSKRQRAIKIWEGQAYYSRSTDQQQRRVTKTWFCYCLNGGVSAFRNICDNSEDTIRVIAKHVASKSITPRIRGNTGKKATNAIATGKTCIMTYADDHPNQLHQGEEMKNHPYTCTYQNTYTEYTYFCMYVKYTKMLQSTDSWSIIILWFMGKNILPNIKISTP